MTWKTGDRIELDMSFSTRAMENMPDGYIAGVASSPSTDLYGHRVLAGAFDESIKRRGLSGPRGVKLLAFHDWHKPAGVLKRLETVGKNLEIEGQLNLNIGYVKDVYEAAKQNGGLSYSVGFSLEEFEFVDEDQEADASKAAGDDDCWVIIQKGDLWEVSVVVFPAQVEAEMTHIKTRPPNTLTEFEKALVADGLCRSRSEAKKIILAMKNSSHLLQGGKPPGEARPTVPQHPWLDVSQLRAATDLVKKAQALLSSR